jgi:hypothetical protein
MAMPALSFTRAAFEKGPLVKLDTSREENSEKADFATHANAGLSIVERTGGSAMYGYNPPKRHELGDIRVMICESEIGKFMDRFPMLTREQILVVMVTAGPTRDGVEHELSRLAKWSADNSAPATRRRDAPKKSN